MRSKEPPTARLRGYRGSIDHDALVLASTGSRIRYTISERAGSPRPRHTRSRDVDSSATVAGRGRGPARARRCEPRRHEWFVGLPPYMQWKVASLRPGTVVNSDIAKLIQDAGIGGLELWPTDPPTDPPRYRIDADFAAFTERRRKGITESD